MTASETVVWAGLPSCNCCHVVPPVSPFLLIRRRSTDSIQHLQPVLYSATLFQDYARPLLLVERQGDSKQDQACCDVLWYFFANQDLSIHMPLRLHLHILPLYLLCRIVSL